MLFLSVISEDASRDDYDTALKLVAHYDFESLPSFRLRLASDVGCVALLLAWKAPGPAVQCCWHLSCQLFEN